MQGVRKILRALAIVVLPVVGTVVIFGSSSGMETAIGWALILLALGLIATWFWQPW
jgi:FtsH-binding integral membrane protein